MRLPVPASSRGWFKLVRSCLSRLIERALANKRHWPRLEDNAALGGQTFLPDLPRVTLSTTVQRKISQEIAPMAMSFVTQTVE